MARRSAASAQSADVFVLKYPTAAVTGVDFAEYTIARNTQRDRALGIEYRCLDLRTSLASLSDRFVCGSGLACRITRQWGWHHCRRIARNRSQGWGGPVTNATWTKGGLMYALPFK